jgi:RND family efflux transporter MFP subunit
MRVISQIIVIGLMTAVAVPLGARFVPGTRPWLDQIGLLQPLAALGVVPDAAEGTAGPSGQGTQPGAGVGVVAQELRQSPLQTVISAIGSARGVQAVDLSFEVTGRLKALAVAPGDMVRAGDVVAELDAEAAQLLADRARLVLEDARKSVARLEQLAQSGTATALQQQEAELALRTAELSLQSAERDLADHRLLAPVTGYVGLIEPQVGDLVSSTTAITRIEDRSSLIVDFRVPERVAALVAVGDTVQASAISLPGAVLEGRIVAVDNRVDEASRTLRVQAVIANAEDRLRAGMAFAIMLTFTGAEYPAVDPLAIQWGAEGAFVWVVREAKVLRVPIRILQRNARSVLIEAEFSPGDMVVTEGVQALRPGADVAVTPPRS